MKVPTDVAFEIEALARANNSNVSAVARTLIRAALRALPPAEAG